MTLLECVDNIMAICSVQPNVNTAAEGDVYNILNGNPATEFSAMVLTQRPHFEPTPDMRRYGFYLFYVDLLKSDKSNKLQVQSQAIETLSNVLAGIGEFADISGVVYNTFTEKFTAECAGAYAEFLIEVPNNNECYEDYA